MAKPATPLDWAHTIGSDLTSHLQPYWPDITCIYGNPFTDADTRLIPGGDCDGPELQIDLGDLYRGGEQWPMELFDITDQSRAGKPSDVAELAVSVWTCIPPPVDGDRSRPDRGDSVWEVAQLGWRLAQGLHGMVFEYLSRGDRGEIHVGRVTPVKDARAGWTVTVRVPVCLTCD
jgi:hypothetical protein